MSNPSSPTSERPIVLSFELRYTRIRDYMGFPEASLDDTSTYRWKAAVRYSPDNPEVLTSWMKYNLESDIVALFDPMPGTLVNREDIIGIKYMELPLGEKTLWFAVYNKPRETWGTLETLRWVLQVALRPRVSPLLYLEDLERGRRNYTVYGVLESAVRDTINGWIGTIA
ncbi:hypothetical protein H072_8793 [Dactylellina haptotyla CBS 200.50]|uniref:Uncharacterized protein n=1 Tax=Dactylellina haptotyla (strain CBS 200.50) TaxID=1284197 RepID=S8A433_DACHA|nr:hypothetical protein H072_8793 [Dactylellina haptotyla CBS 200.50]